MGEIRIERDREGKRQGERGGVIGRELVTLRFRERMRRGGLRKRQWERQELRRKEKVRGGGEI